MCSSDLWQEGTEHNQELQKDFNTSKIKVIENVPYEKEEVISYVYGGG